jgi:hypothetical protein
MRGKTLLILTVVVLGVGAFIWLYGRHQPGTDELVEQADKVLPGFETDAVVEVRVDGGAAPVTLAKQGDAWRLTAPLDFPADDSKVTTLLSSLANLKADRRLPTAEVDPADYGLDDPPFRVTLVDASGAETVVNIGDETPLGAKRALRVDDHPELILTAAYFVSDLGRSVDDWRSRDVVDLLPDQVASIDVLAGSDRIRVVRVKDRWQLLEPLEDLADRDHIRNLIADLNAMRITTFIDGEPDDEALGLVQPAFEVTVVRSDGGEPVRLALGVTRDHDGATEVACRRGDHDPFWVNEPARIRLAKAPVRWRSAKVWPFDAWDVESLTIAAAGDEITLDRSTGAWKVSDGSPADSAAVQDRLTALADLTADQFDLTEPPTAEIGRVTLGFEGSGDGDGESDQGAKVELVFHRPLVEGGNAMVVVSARPTVMGVPMAEVDAILADPAALREAVEPTPSTAPASSDTEVAPTD